MNEAWRTLGVRLALDGNNDEEYRFLQGVMAAWKNHMITAKIHTQQQTLLSGKCCYPKYTICL